VTTIIRRSIGPALGGLRAARHGTPAAVAGAVTDTASAVVDTVGSAADAVVANVVGKAADLVEHGGGVAGTARLLRDIRQGRSQRTLAGLTAAGSVITAAEIFFEHDRSSFGNRVMWWPVMLGPVGGIAGIAGFCSPRMATTALPIASLAIVANGVQGTYLHVRGIAQKPGGFRRNAKFNIETGPPLFAPLLMTMVGGMGLVAALLRRER